MFKCHKIIVLILSLFNSWLFLWIPPRLGRRLAETFKQRKGEIPGNLIDKRLQFFGLVRSGERPAHVAGGVAHVGTDAARSPLLLVAQGFDNKWYHWRQTWVTDVSSKTVTNLHFRLIQHVYWSCQSVLWCWLQKTGLTKPNGKSLCYNKYYLYYKFALA